MEEAGVIIPVKSHVHSRLTWSFEAHSQHPHGSESIFNVANEGAALIKGTYEDPKVGLTRWSGEHHALDQRLHMRQHFFMCPEKLLLEPKRTRPGISLVRAERVVLGKIEFQASLTNT